MGHSDDSDEEITLKAKEIKNLLADQDNEIEMLTKKVKNAKNQFRNEILEKDRIVSRYEKEITNAQHFSISSLAKDLLSVRDDLQRAFDYSTQNKEEVSPQEEDLKNLQQGLTMANTVFEKTLNRAGVEKIEALGDQFDKKIHNYEGTEEPEGEITKITTPGYKIGDKVLRKPTVLTQPTEEIQ